MMLQYCFIILNLVANYHLVVSYPQQCHIGINKDYCYIIIIPMHIILLFAFSLFL